MPQSVSTSILFDVIVLGVGSMGAPACYYLAKKGYKVLGLEQFSISHEFGSHAGQSRIIRKAYFEHPNYVPLLKRAYENWKSLEEETGEKIYHETGLVYFGEHGSEMLNGVMRSADLYDIPVETFDNAEAAIRFNTFNIPGSFVTLFEPGAGFVTPEKAIRLYAGQAIKNGAEIHTGEKVIEWRKDGNGIAVRTNKNNYRCGKLIISAGAWSGKMIPALSGRLKVTRQFFAWIKPKAWDRFMLHDFPCWLLTDDKRPGCYYGFPVISSGIAEGPVGLKIAHHYPGTNCDPDHVNREIVTEDLEDLHYALEKYLPGVFDSLIAAKTCLYTNTPDENFIIDKFPDNDHVIIACGFSGHGFKFAPVIGEILAELASKGATSQPIDFLSASRLI